MAQFDDTSEVNQSLSISDDLQKLHTSLSSLSLIPDLREDGQHRPRGRTAKIPPITCCVKTEDEIISHIKRARNKNKIVRAEGSGHSYHKAIASGDDIVLRLSGELRSFEVISGCGSLKSVTVRVGGGCCIGVNILDEESTEENSLIYQLNQINCALPNLGGIAHQTIAGFMSTGSAGASIHQGWEDVIREIHFINGLAEKKIAKKGSDLFNAVGVSLGLFGIITYVVLEVPSPSFLVAGQQIKRDFKEYEIENKTVKDILESNEYAHLLWFPQKHAQFVVEWTAQKSTDGEVRPFTNSLSNKAMAQEVSALLRVSHWLLEKEPRDETYQIIGLLLKLITRDTDQTFNDVWSSVLSSNDKVPVETIFQRQFTEMWFPIEKTQEVINILKLLFKDQKVAGNYGTEIYGAKKSEFWLSHSYNHNVVRVNPYWFVFQDGHPRRFFNNFWEVFLSVEGIRFHWAMFLPEPGKMYGGTKFDLKFLKKSYPKLDEWLEERERMDPDQVFVTEYWRKIFEIKDKK